MSSRKELRGAAEALNSGAIHVLRGLGPVDRRAGLTPARLSALSVLVFGGACTLGRLAKAEGVAGPTMTRIVDGLVALGLADRSDAPDDGRVSVVSATPAGERLMLDARRRRIDALAEAIATLPQADQRRLVVAVPLLDRVANALAPRTVPSAPTAEAG